MLLTASIWSKAANSTVATNADLASWGASHAKLLTLCTSSAMPCFSAQRKKPPLLLVELPSGFLVVGVLTSGVVLWRHSPALNLVHVLVGTSVTPGLGPYVGYHTGVAGY
jgi:hypothetical protein